MNERVAEHRLARWSSLLSLLIVLGVHVVVRLRPALQVLGSSQTEPVFGGTDSFCHAHRARLLFEAFPRWVFHDRFMFHPQGTIAEWPLGFDFTSAAALRVLSASWSDAVWWLPFATLLWSLLALLTFVAFARVHLQTWHAHLLSLCFALNLAFVRVSTLTEYDHHVVETLCVVCLIALPTWLSIARHHAQRAMCGVALCWMVWTSTLLAFLIVGALGLWLIAARIMRRPLPPLRAFALGLLAPLAVIAAVESAARAAWWSASTLSLLHVALIAAALLALSMSQRLSLGHWVGVGVSSIALALLLAPGALAWIASFVTATDPMIANINESKPLFIDRDGFTLLYAHWFFGPAWLLFPVASVVVMRALLRQRTAVSESSSNTALLFAVLLSSALFVLALSQKRFAHLCVPGFVFVLGYAASRLQRADICACLLALLLLEPIAVFLDETASPISDSTRLSIAVAHTLRDAADGRDDLGVSAPPNLGSVINYAAHLPSVTSAFFYPRYMQADLTLREIESSDALIAYLRKQRLGFLVAVDDARYRTMLLRMLDQPLRAREAEAIEKTPCQGPQRYAYDRVACGVEVPADLVPLMQTQVSRDPTRLWRRLSVFRVRQVGETAP